MKRTERTNRITGLAMTAAGLATAAGLVLWASSGADAAEPSGFSNLPDTVTLTGIVRDFRERQVPGGHPDFELRPAAGFAHYYGIVQDTLDAEGKPVFRSTGYKRLTQWVDGQGRPIIPSRDYIAARSGDVAGSMSESEGGAVTGAERLRQWFRDVPGVNMSAAFPITLERVPGTNRYVFDDKLDTNFARLNGFFIVNNTLFGNSQGGNKNFHFTYELSTEFVYKPNSGQVFTFTGDDDVWVFIDDRLVIDIGGVHSAVSQTIDLDRLDWLVDGQTYSLKFFYAERHRTQANFRIETTLNLRNAELPRVTGMYD